MPHQDFIMPKTIIFDWDGTLVDTFPLLHMAYNHILAHFDMPVWSEQEARQNIHQSAREAFPKRFGDKADLAMEMYFDFVRQRHVDHVNIIPKTHDLLSLLDSMNVQMAIVSNKKDEFLQKEVAHLGLDDFFKAIIGAGRAKHDKPSPDPVWMAMDHMAMSYPQFGSITPDIWYMGDTRNDMICAKTVGICPVFIGHGQLSIGDVADLDVMYHYQNFDDLIDQIKKKYTNMQ